MVKILGGSLVLIAAYLFGMKLMEPAAEHIRLLEEGDLLYRILESEIRNTRTPLPILFGELSDRTNTRWHNFFFISDSQYLSHSSLPYALRHSPPQTGCGDIFSAVHIPRWLPSPM